MVAVAVGVVVAVVVVVAVAVGVVVAVAVAVGVVVAVVVGVTTFPLLGSASGLHRTLICPASIYLPEGPRHERAEVAAAAGKRVHLQLQIDPKPKHAGYYTTPERRELKLCFNSRTGTARVLTAEGDREYGELEDTETPGTADVAILGFKMFEVHDYKTGKSAVQAPAKNDQLLHLALCISRSLCPHATHAVLGIQKVWGEKVVTEAAIVDQWALDAHETRLLSAQAVAREARAAVAAGQEPPLHPGPHCRWCPARVHCPVAR